MTKPWEHGERQEEDNNEKGEAGGGNRDEGGPSAFVFKPSTHRTTDPEYPGDDASASAMNKYRKVLGEYTMELLDAFEECARLGLIGEKLWKEAKDSWNCHAIQHMSDAATLRLRFIMYKGGVLVENKDGLSRREALWMCLTSETFPVLERLDDERVDVSAIDDMERDEDKDTVADVSNKEKPQETTTDERKESNNVKSNGYSMSSLMKAYSGRPLFAGDYGDNITEAIELYDTLCTVCGVEDEDKLKCVPIMLKDSALKFYNSNLRSCVTYSECMERLTSWYTSDEQRNRLLQEWQSMRLSSMMELCPSKSQVAVFRELSAKLSSIQRQLHPDYHKDRFLRDQLVRSADSPQIKRALRERIPATAQEANQRIAALLSSDAGSASAYSRTMEHDQDSVSYGADTLYGGKATKELKRRNGNRGRSRRIRGCWCCGKDHFARDHHSQREIKKSLERHRRNGRVYLNIEDVVKILDDSEDETDRAQPVDDSSSEYSAEEGDMFNYGFSEINLEVSRELSTKALIHGFELKRKGDISKMEEELAKSEDFQPSFEGIMIDTGANRSSVMSLEQYRAYCREHLRVATLNSPKIDTTSSKTLHGFAGSEATIGHADIEVPIQGLGIAPIIRFHIVRGSCPSILCLRDMQRVGLDISIQNQCLTLGNRRHSLKLKNNLLWLTWIPADQILYTSEELRKLHRSFGHPSARALSEMLKRARPNNPCVRDELEKIVRECITCAKHARRPRRFKLTLGTDDYRFNHIVAIDIMYIDGKSILHCVDESTHFGSAAIVPSMKSDDVWKTLLNCWSLVYLGPPDFLRIDQGSNFVSAEFKASAQAEGITILEAPVESPETMSHVERYHSPLRCAYLKIKSSLPRTRPSEILQLAVKAVNDTTGPEGLCPTLLVFGAIPKPARPGFSPKQVERALAIELAMKEVSKVHAKTRVKFGLKHNGPKGGEREDLDKLFPGAHVLVYRKKLKKWDGPYVFIDKVGETICVQLPQGRRIFRSTAVKPAPKDSISLNAFDESEISAAVDFSESRKIEMDGLNARKVFECVPRLSVPKGRRIYKLGWVEKLKTLDDGTTVMKSRIVARNYRDAAATSIPTRSPTVSRWAQRLAFALAAMSPERQTYIRDISQAYVQSESLLSRDIYLEPLPEMKLSDELVLRAIKPLYGIPESGLYWFDTYHRHHTDRLEMVASKADPCFLYNRQKATNEYSSIPNFVILQVDDSLGNGDASFQNFEK